MQEWLNGHWAAAGLCTAILLTVLMPVLAQRWPLAWLLIFAMLPIYMFHQVEEHTGDRFRVFVNQHVFHGVEALTPLAVLWINLQLRVLRLGLLQDGDVGVRILPSCQEIIVGFAAVFAVALFRVGLRQAELRERRK
jgi:hypothetical protein